MNHCLCFVIHAELYVYIRQVDSDEHLVPFVFGLVREHGVCFLKIIPAPLKLFALVVIVPTVVEIDKPVVGIHVAPVLPRLVPPFLAHLEVAHGGIGNAYTHVYGYDVIVVLLFPLRLFSCFNVVDDGLVVVSCLLVGVSKIDYDVNHAAVWDGFCILCQHVCLVEILIRRVGIANAFNPVQSLNAVVFNPNDILYFVMTAVVAL